MWAPLAASAGPYQTSAEALSAAQSGNQAAEQATSCMHGIVEKNRANNDAAAKAAGEVSKLIREKRKSLQELAQGYYCSQCATTASEIEAQERIAFSQHLHNVQGKPIPAPASKIRA